MSALACGHERELAGTDAVPGCGEWNTLVEDGAPPRGSPRADRTAGASRQRAVAFLADVSAPELPRLLTGIGELDRVLGGGIVPGSVVLLGGAPGIGKSTLTNMALGNLAARGHRTLYVSGEESPAQVRLRAERLSGAALAVPAIAETDLEAVVATLERVRPEVCVIDSVQTLDARELSGARSRGRWGRCARWRARIVAGRQVSAANRVCSSWGT